MRYSSLGVVSPSRHVQKRCVSTLYTNDISDSSLTTSKRSGTSCDSKYQRPSGDQTGGVPKGGGAQNFAFFSLSHSHFRSFLPSLGVLSWNFGDVFEGRKPWNKHVWPLGLSCETPAASGPLDFTREPENSNRAYLRVPVCTKITKFNEKTQRERHKERKWGREREKKERNFGRSGGGGWGSDGGGGPAEDCPTEGGSGRKDPVVGGSQGNPIHTTSPKRTTTTTTHNHNNKQPQETTTHNNTTHTTTTQTTQNNTNTHTNNDPHQPQHKKIDFPKWIDQNWPAKHDDQKWIDQNWIARSRPYSMMSRRSDVVIIFQSRELRSIPQIRTLYALVLETKTDSFVLTQRASNIMDRSYITHTSFSYPIWYLVRRRDQVVREDEVSLSIVVEQEVFNHPFDSSIAIRSVSIRRRVKYTFSVSYFIHNAAVSGADERADVLDLKSVSPIVWSRVSTWSLQNFWLSEQIVTSPRASYDTPREEWCLFWSASSWSSTRRLFKLSRLQILCQ